MRTILAAGAAAILIAFWIRGVLSLARPRSDREDWIVLLALVATACVMVPSCVIVERLTGVSPHSTEPSFIVRQGSAVVAFIAWMAFVIMQRGWRQNAAERAAFIRARDAFAIGKTCIACRSPLNLDRLHHAVRDDGADANDYWMNVCQCGERTLFGPDGSPRRVVDRSDTGSSTTTHRVDG